MAAVDPEVLRKLVAEQLASIAGGGPNSLRGGGAGPLREVWGCKCGEKSNWSNRLNCRACGLGRPEGVGPAIGAVVVGQSGGSVAGSSARPSLPGTPGRPPASSGGAVRTDLGSRRPAALSVAVPTSKGWWVNLEDEEDQLLLQLAKTRKAKAKVEEAAAAAEAARSRVEALKTQLRQAHQDLQACEEATKTAKATLRWEEGRLATAKQKELGTASPTPRSAVAVQTAGWEAPWLTDDWGGWGQGWGWDEGTPRGSSEGAPPAVPMDADGERKEEGPPDPPAGAPAPAGALEGGAAGDSAPAEAPAEAIRQATAEGQGAGAPALAGTQLDADTGIEAVEVEMGEDGPAAGGPSLAASAALAAGKSVRGSRRTSAAASRRSSVDSLAAVFKPKIAKGLRRASKAKAKSQKERKAELRAAAGHVGAQGSGGSSGSKGPLTVAALLGGRRT